MTNDMRFIQKTIALAQANAHAGLNGPFGALITEGATILGEGVNQVVKRHDPTAHAEVMAIRAACRVRRSHDLTGCTLYTSCEPCPMCLATAYWARLDRIVFACTRDDAAAAGFDDAAIYHELPLPWSARRMKYRQVGRREGLKILKHWNAHPAKRPY